MALSSSLHNSLETNERATAHRIFDDIIHAFEPIQTRLCDRYEPVTLIRVMRDEVSETDAFLGLFFGVVQHCLLGVERGDVGDVLGYLGSISALGEGEMERLGESEASFADFPG
ncbi:hypothetical protein DPV78_012741 [Talaromyces pinophilus]|nr:hypothetical protein DPV78_012741 [Talaromyces pinophilus]